MSLRHPTHIHTQYNIPDYSSIDANSPLIENADEMDSHRKDLRHLHVYTIDPSGSTDADDAFSLYIHPTNGTTHLYIHIADPTAYFTRDHPLFNFIIENGVTQYPTFRPPHHMFPDNVVEKMSLIHGEKRALTVEYTWHEETFIGSKLFFSLIMCDKTRRYSYREAATLANASVEAGLQHTLSEPSTTLHHALLLSNMLAKQRDDTFKILNDLHPSHVVERNGSIYMEKIDIQEQRMKRMIAEFAIATNGVVAKYLYNYDPTYIFTRECNAEQLKKMNYHYGSAEDLLTAIVSNGITACYTREANKHELVGVSLYTHSTSPLRRATDVIVHFMVKEAYRVQSIIQEENNNLTREFTLANLSYYADKCNVADKKHKNLQFSDFKFRYYQAIALLMQREGSVTIKYYVNSIVRKFINLRITDINDHKVSISYVIRSPVNPKYDWIKRTQNENGTHKKYSVECKSIKIPITMFDTHVLPELERHAAIQVDPSSPDRWIARM